MEQILIVSSSEAGREHLESFATEQNDAQIRAVSDGKEARKLLEEEVYDLVIVNAPLSDEHGEAVARKAYDAGMMVMLLVKTEYADAVWERIRSTGIYMMPKPLKRTVFLQTLQCIRMQKKQLQRLEQEKERLSRKIQDTALINRAKLVLMQVLKLSEPQAHHYIEKQAMDLRITKREVAEGVINTYEN